MGGNGAGPQAGGGDPMAALVAGLQPVKSGVDMILQGAKQIVQSGIIPGAEQACGQIVALATALLPQAAQQVMGPGAGWSPRRSAERAYAANRGRSAGGNPSDGGWTRSRAMNGVPKLTGMSEEPKPSTGAASKLSRPNFGGLKREKSIKKTLGARFGRVKGLSGGGDLSLRGE